MNHQIFIYPPSATIIIPPWQADIDLTKPPAIIDGEGNEWDWYMSNPAMPRFKSFEDVKAGQEVRPEAWPKPNIDWITARWITDVFRNRKTGQLFAIVTEKPELLIDQQGCGIDFATQVSKEIQRKTSEEEQCPITVPPRQRKPHPDTVISFWVCILVVVLSPFITNGLQFIGLVLLSIGGMWLSFSGKRKSGQP